MSQIKKPTLALFSLALITSLLLAAPVAAQGKDRPATEPSFPTTFEQRVPINLVFLGYSRSQIDEAALLGQLPATYTPVVRFPRFYGVTGRDLGLQYNFEYRTFYPSAKLQDKFFQFLADTGVSGDPTSFQLGYNDQVNNVLDVTGPVLYVDAASVEDYLASGALGKWSKRGYTLVFINWYSRPDFQFHLYTRLGEPDPDTGVDFGERDSRKLIAWGGSTSRTWFYDLSAGPESWTDNWNVDDPDLDGDGVEDYRMPPVWEYAAGGYRAPSDLSSDLGLVTRYVGIDLLFTTSPLYDPLVTMPGVGGDKVAHINLFEDDPASNGTDWINIGHFQAEMQDFQPYYNWQTALVDNNPIDADAQRAFRIFADLLPEDDCWNSFFTTFAELFCFFDANRSAYIPAYGADDYVGGIFAFNTTDDNLGSQFGLLGFADDNWVDGTQTYVFQFDTEFYRFLGYGFTSTTVHEFGHHVGMSHPHDGYDSETDVDFGPGNEFYFAWSGDESDTVMHYLALSNGFSQFDRDNMYRIEMAGYLNMTTGLLDTIKGHSDAHTVQPLIQEAFLLRFDAFRSFMQWDYLAAATTARAAYEKAAEAAEALSIDLSALNTVQRLAPTQMAPHEGDPIRFPDN